MSVLREAENGSHGGVREFMYGMSCITASNHLFPLLFHSGRISSRANGCPEPSKHLLHSVCSEVCSYDQILGDRIKCGDLSSGIWVSLASHSVPAHSSLLHIRNVFGAIIWGLHPGLAQGWSSLAPELCETAHHKLGFPVKEHTASFHLAGLEFSCLSLPSVHLSPVLASLASEGCIGKLSSDVCGCMDWKCLSLIWWSMNLLPETVIIKEAVKPKLVRSLNNGTLKP